MKSLSTWLNILWKQQTPREFWRFSENSIQIKFLGMLWKFPIFLDTQKKKYKTDHLFVYSVYKKTTTSTQIKSIWRALKYDEHMQFGLEYSLAYIWKHYLSVWPNSRRIWKNIEARLHEIDVSKHASYLITYKIP